MKTFVGRATVCVVAIACSPAQTKQGDTSASEEHVTCWYEKPTGTRVKKKVCGTDSERAMALQDDRVRVDDIRRQSSAEEAQPGSAMMPRP